jgi:cystathionine beta-lyase/cystathionine gamma-synthase
MRHSVHGGNEKWKQNFVMEVGEWLYREPIFVKIIYSLLQKVFQEVAFSAVDMGGGGLFSWQVKGTGHEPDHTYPSIAEARNDGAISCLPHTFSWHGA